MIAQPFSSEDDRMGSDYIRVGEGLLFVGGSHDLPTRLIWYCGLADRGRRRYLALRKGKELRAFTGSDIPGFVSVETVSWSGATVYSKDRYYDMVLRPMVHPIEFKESKGNKLFPCSSVRHDWPGIEKFFGGVERGQIVRMLEEVNLLGEAKRLDTAEIQKKVIETDDPLLDK